MDKFVLKNPRNLQEKRNKSPKKKLLRQRALQSLAGVVVIEEFEQYKITLESDQASQEKKLTVLNKLLDKNPSKEVLIKVGIGKTVRSLRKVGDPTNRKIQEIQKLSDKVYKKWRSELERKVELKHNPIRVKSDKVASLNIHIYIIMDRTCHNQQTHKKKLDILQFAK